MITTVLIDDEPSSIEGTSILLDEFVKDVEVVGSAGSVSDGIKLIEEELPDLVILDIHLPDGSGFDIIDAFPDPSFEALFHTAFSEYAISAIKTRVLDYLLKPTSVEELKSAIVRVRSALASKKAAQRSSGQMTKIALNGSKVTKMVDLNDLVCLEADGAYTQVQLRDETIMVSKNLRYFEQLLETSGSFLRVHRSAIVNMNHILEIVKAEGGHLLMSNQVCINLPSKGREHLLNELKSFGIVIV